MAPDTFKPYLSIVAASRNDDHGGDPLRRTRIFVNCFARQCEKHHLPAELIIVDWNPVPGRPGLGELLRLPPDTSYCRARVITVSHVLHRGLKYSDRLPLYQMIAKNAGIRRALGQFILATNIDIVFSDELMGFIARRTLDPEKLYRVDRYDIQAGLSEELSLEETLEYAWANPVRQNRRFGPKALVKHLSSGAPSQRTCAPDPDFCRRLAGVSVSEKDGVWQVQMAGDISAENLHTNACGDFTLLAREAWETIRGYPEFEAYSFNIDSMGLLAAHYSGYHEVSLLPPCVAFHIEHGLGSGWSPEGAQTLFARLDDSGILNPDWPVLNPLVEKMQMERQALKFNRPSWGLNAFELPDEEFGATSRAPGADPGPADEDAGTRRVGSLLPAYDLDLLTLAYERHYLDDRLSAELESVRLFIPSESGAYDIKRSKRISRCLRERELLVFRVQRFASNQPLRLNPVNTKGVVEIASLILLETDSGKAAWRLTRRNAAALPIGGTAKRLESGLELPGSKTEAPLHILSTGDDPQIFLPPLKGIPAFPLLLLVELRFVR